MVFQSATETKSVTCLFYLKYKTKLLTAVVLMVITDKISHLRFVKHIVLLHVSKINRKYFFWSQILLQFQLKRIPPYVVS